MESRLKTSTKWTTFPEELISQIEAVFNEFFAEYDLQNGVFKAQGAIFPTEIVLRVGLAVPNQLRRDNFEVSIAYNPDQEKATEVIQQLSDALGIIWEDHLEEEVPLIELPLLWQPYTKNSPIHYRYTSINADLEKEADLLLQQYDKQLVYGEDTLDEENIDKDFVEEILRGAHEGDSPSDEENPLH